MGRGPVMAPGAWVSVAAAGALAASCYTSSSVPVAEPAAPPEAGESRLPAAAMTIQPASLGPLTARTQANLVALRAALPGYEVKPLHVMLGATTNQLGYAVYKDGEKLLHVMPDGKGAIFAVHATSTKIAVEGRSWRIGAKLTSVKALSTCSCWEEELVVCWKPGDHVAVTFTRECGWDTYATEDELQDLIGAPIHRLIWSPKPFTDESSPYGGADYGGEEYGGY